jgi:hypothetical protein
VRRVRGTKEKLYSEREEEVWKRDDGKTEPQILRSTKPRVCSSNPSCPVEQGTANINKVSLFYIVFLLNF